MTGRNAKRQPSVYTLNEGLSLFVKNAFQWEIELGASLKKEELVWLVSQISAWFYCLYSNRVMWDP